MRADHDPEEVRRLADQILAGDAFADHRSLVERILDWIGRQLGRDPGAGAGPALGGVGTVLAWLVVLALVVGVAYVLVRSWRPPSRRRRPDHRASIEHDARRSAAQWLEEARRQEASGEWKLGLRSRYRALVAGLVDAGALRDVAGSTTGEHRAAVGASLPTVAPAFAEAAQLFERAWYGAAPTGADEAGRFAAAGDEVLAAVVPGRPHPVERAGVTP